MLLSEISREACEIERTDTPLLAAGFFIQAIEPDPAFARAYYTRGVFRFKLGDRAGALADAQRAVELANDRGNQPLYKDAMKLLKLAQSTAPGTIQTAPSVDSTFR